jgi:hypothetical protein
MIHTHRRILRLCFEYLRLPVKNLLQNSWYGLDPWLVDGEAVLDELALVAVGGHIRTTEAVADSSAVSTVGFYLGLKNLEREASLSRSSCS